MDTLTTVMTLALLSYTSPTTAQTLAGSAITCATERECQNYVIDCTSNSDCTVTCSGTTSCLGATINGPLSANSLTVVCDYDACRSATITGPSNGALYIECKDKSACSYFTVNAHQGTTYLDILITGTADTNLFFNGWGVGKIYCPISQSAGSCALRVSGLISTESNVLKGVHIYAVNGFNDLSIACEGSDTVDTCFDVLDPSTPLLFCGSSYDYGCFIAPKTITATSAMDWDCNTDTRMTHETLCADGNGLDPGVYGNNIECDLAKICNGVRFRCHDGEDCNINCVYHNACWWAVMYGPRNGNFNVLCGSDTQSGGQYICAMMKIYGPTNGALSVVCDDTLAGSGNNCRGMLINGSAATHLDFSSNHADHLDWALRGTSIYCPPFADSCSITVSGSATNMMGDVSIYAENAFYSLSLTCNYGVSVADNCYATEPILYCKGADCPLALQSGNSDWECSSGSSWIDICDSTLDPTFDPTFNPTFNPTFIPTLDPTFNPTFDPTFNPTFNPTLPKFDARVALETTNIDDDDDASVATAQKSDNTMEHVMLVSFLAGLVVAGLVSFLVMRKKYKNAVMSEATIAEEAQQRQAQQLPGSISITNSGMDIVAPDAEPEAKMDDMKSNDDTSEDSGKDEDLYENEGHRDETTKGTVGGTTGGPQSVETYDGIDHDDNVLQGGNTTVRATDDGLTNGTCADCAIYTEIGKIYGGDGLFYCLDCWKYYEPNTSNGVEKVENTETMS